MNLGERRFCDFMYNKSGSFYKTLFEAIFRADKYNLAKLKKGFPEEVDAYLGYTRTAGYWEKLENEYKR